MMNALETCLVVVTRPLDGRCHVLLGEKLRGFGKGRVVVPGGKVADGETPRRAAARELAEETSLIVDEADLAGRGIITFRFPDGGGVDMRAHVFVADDVAGGAAESDELSPVWVPLDALPTARMWPDTAHWLSLALDGDVDGVEFTYAADGITLTDTTRPSNDKAAR